MNILLVDAFTLWWAMGDDRSLEVLAQRSGIPLVVLCERFGRERWDRRLEELDRTLVFDLEKEESLAEFEGRLRLLVEFMKGKGADGMLRFPATPELHVERIVAGSSVLLIWETPRRRRRRGRKKRSSP